MSRREQVLSQRDKILALAFRHGASDVRLFGSVARGDDRADSDVDVIVRFPSGATLNGLCGLGDELEKLLHCKVDLITEHPGLGQRLRKNIQEDMLAL